EAAAIGECEHVFEGRGPIGLAFGKSERAHSWCIDETGAIGEHRQPRSRRGMATLAVVVANGCGCSFFAVTKDVRVEAIEQCRLADAAVADERNRARAHQRGEFVAAIAAGG